VRPEEGEDCCGFVLRHVLRLGDRRPIVKENHSSSLGAARSKPETQVSVSIVRVIAT
jgi:hypothetical protein